MYNRNLGTYFIQVLEIYSMKNIALDVGRNKQKRGTKQKNSLKI